MKNNAQNDNSKLSARLAGYAILSFSIGSILGLIYSSQNFGNAGGSNPTQSTNITTTPSPIENAPLAYTSYGFVALSGLLLTAMCIADAKCIRQRSVLLSQNSQTILGGAKGSSNTEQTPLLNTETIVSIQPGL